MPMLGRPPDLCKRSSAGSERHARPGETDFQLHNSRNQHKLDVECYRLAGLDGLYLLVATHSLVADRTWFDRNHSYARPEVAPELEPRP